MLVLRGELDLAGTPRLEAALDAAMAAAPERIILEPGQLEFVDGSSVGLIERKRRPLRARGALLTLRHPQPHVRRVIELCARLSGLGQDLNGGPPASARPSGRGRGGRALSGAGNDLATGDAGGVVTPAWASDLHARTAEAHCEHVGWLLAGSRGYLARSFADQPPGRVPGFSYGDDDRWPRALNLRPHAAGRARAPRPLISRACRPGIGRSSGAPR
jgi:anti-anti-sigma factor